MKKTFSLLLSLLILLSSLNFNLSAHYCGQQLVDVALFGEAEVCLMAKEKACELDKMPCCTNRNIIIESEDYLTVKNFETQEIEKIDILIADLQFPIELLLEKQHTNTFLPHYIPPLIELDIMLAVQSFLL